jgi:hypothetical protein
MKNGFLHIIMAGMFFLLESIPMPLYSLDGSHKLSHTNCTDYVFISGATNVNQFNFLYSRPNMSAENTHFEQFDIDIPVKDFVPSNPFMYNDFLSLLRADEYPVISISIPQGQLDSDNTGFDAINPDVNITIAGITRTYKLNCSVERCSGGLLIAGSQALKLSDFNLKRVERLGGLIKLHDEIDVSFGFIVNFTAMNQISSQK